MVFILCLVRKLWLGHKPLGPFDPAKIVGLHPTEAKVEESKASQALSYRLPGLVCSLAEGSTGSSWKSLPKTRSTALLPQLDLAQILENVEGENQKTSDFIRQELEDNMSSFYQN